MSDGLASAKIKLLLATNGIDSGAGALSFDLDILAIHIDIFFAQLLDIFTNELMYYKYNNYWNSTRYIEDFE